MSRNRRPYMAQPPQKPTSESEKASVKPVVKPKIDAPKKIGRPSIRTPEIEQEILFRLSEGESIRKMCKDKHMPDRETVSHWMIGDARFSADIARAREIGMDAIGEEIIEIADNGANDFIEDEKGNKRVNWESVQRAKLQCDARRWYLSKLAPKTYGDKITQQHEGPDGGPMQIQQPMTPREVEVAITQMLRTAEVEMKMPAPPGMSNPDRLERLVTSGKTIPPDLYLLTHSWRTGNVH